METELVEKIRVIMKQRKITQRKIAEDIGVSENYVNQMLGRGKSKRRSVSLKVLIYLGIGGIEIKDAE